MISLKGLGVALITPFKNNKEIDFTALERLLEHIKNDIDYLIVFGTTSETPTISKDEKKEILNFVKQNVQIPIILGIGGYNTTQIIEDIKQQDFEGISAILSVTPYYNKPNQRGLVEHYTAIADNSPVPIVLYNVTPRTAVNISASTALQLAQHKNIVAVKEASGDLKQIMEIIKNKPAEFSVVSGDDGITLPLISLGVEGLISVIANAYPKLMRKLVWSALEGNFEEAKQIHYKLLPAINAIFKEGNPAGIKALLSVKGIIKNNLRLPLVPVSNELMAEMEHIDKNIIDK
jgi:4-hydroxy-tetrahydrodipicolinate synthase